MAEAGVIYVTATCTYNPNYTLDESCRTYMMTTDASYAFAPGVQLFTATYESSSGSTTSSKWVAERSDTLYRSCIPGPNSCVSSENAGVVFMESSCAPGHTAISTAIEDSTTTLICCPKVPEDRLISRSMTVTSLWSWRRGGSSAYGLYDYTLCAYTVVRTALDESLLPASDEPSLSLSLDSSSYRLYYTVEAHRAIFSSTATAASADQLTKALPGSTSGVASSTAIPGTGKSSGSLSSGAKLGIGFGVSLGTIVMMVVLGLLFLRRRQKKKKEYNTLYSDRFEKAELQAIEAEPHHKFVHELSPGTILELDGAELAAEAPAHAQADDAEDIGSISSRRLKTHPKTPEEYSGVGDRLS